MAARQARHLSKGATAIMLALALVVLPAEPGFGQSTGGGGSGNAGGNAPSTDGGSATSAVASPGATSAILLNINAVRGECARYDPVYRIDCLRQGLKAVADRIPASGDYGQARRIIAQAASRLGSIQARNADSAQPRQRSRGNARFKRQRTLTAVKRENLRQAMQAAQNVIAEAETQLLRSGENSQKRAGHYQQISAAIGSTKVLLRSA